MKKYIKPALFVALGLVLAFPVFSITYYTMMRTSTPEFCALCHEIKPAVRAWRSSRHASNRFGFVADCVDCHLPAPSSMFSFFYAKTAHGIKDVVLHFMGEPYDRNKMRARAWATIDNVQCMKCHRNLLYLTQHRGAMLAHRAVLYPLPGYEKRCLDCHRNLVHVERPLYASQ